MRDNWSLPPRSWLQTVLVTGLTAIRSTIIAVLVLFVLGPMLLDLAKVKRGSPAVNVMYDGRTYVRQTAGTEIAKYIPTKFAGKDRTDWVLLVGLLLAAGLVGSIRTRIDWAMDRRALRRSAEKWRAELKVPAQSKIAVALDAKLQELQAGKTLDHQELLRIFAETKRKLDALGRDLAFLSVDIVGSTQMKQNEESAAIQHDFIEYRKMVERVFANAGC
jgi:hypothetical protein